MTTSFVFYQCNQHFHEYRILKVSNAMDAKLSLLKHVENIWTRMFLFCMFIWYTITVNWTKNQIFVASYNTRGFLDFERILYRHNLNELNMVTMDNREIFWVVNWVHHNTRTWICDTTSFTNIFVLQSFWMFCMRIQILQQQKTTQSRR